MGARGHSLREQYIFTVGRIFGPDRRGDRKRTGLTSEAAVERVLTPDYPTEDKTARYYQTTATNRTVEAIVSGIVRALLVMATGTGKTSTASPKISHSEV